MILSPLPILRQNLVHYSVGRTELCDLYDFLGVVSRHSKSALLSCSLGVCSWPKTGFPEFRTQEWANIISPHSHFFITDSHTFQNTSEIYKTSPIPRAAFQPPESTEYRVPDTIDTFETYKFRKTCNVSSLDLHAPFSPLCQDRASMLTAMSSGGRIGHDAPYMPRGCDMRWFSAEEICEILGRFDKVVLIGDSMLRHIIGSINILIRKDLGYGAVTDWNFSLQERYHWFYCLFNKNLLTSH